MGTAVYARIGAITGNSKYFEQAWTAFNISAFTPHPSGYSFWSPTEQLFYRDPPMDNPNGVFWARGNGWVAAALADVLRLSSPGDAAVPAYAAAFKAFMGRLVGLQGAEGCWRTSLTNPGAAEKCYYELCAVQCSTVQCSTVQYSAVQYSAVQCAVTPITQRTLLVS
jgi:rhamnogalacturonyl hydrolase YesR